MKRFVGRLLAAGAVIAVMAVTAPAASAAEGDAAAMQDCTTIYAETLARMSTPEELVSVTYTPPATVTVDADPAVGVVRYVVGATVAYIQCID